ncbi:MAG: hypothetical protein HY711_02105, partial [Candidatus Melainabacteria bacterium]|nr:hypothetical protein [Candidatus Melainabacteria bacterium]
PLLHRLLKAHANLFLALRVEERTLTMGGSPMPNRVVDSQWQIKKEWLELFEQFPDRFVIGSDEFFGIPGKSRRSPQSFEETWSTLKQLPTPLQDKIGRQNALKIYGLDN